VHRDTHGRDLILLGVDDEPAVHSFARTFSLDQQVRKRPGRTGLNCRQRHVPLPGELHHMFGMISKRLLHWRTSGLAGIQREIPVLAP
jgi:hypothetical protein